MKTEAPRAREDDLPLESALTTALDALPVLAWTSGTNKEGLYFNQAWLEFTGRDLEQELGEGWLETVHPDDLPALAACDEAFDRREPFQIEFRLRRSDGTWRWVLDKARPRFAADGSFAGFVGCCIDITERKAVEASLRSSEEALQLAQEAASVGTYDWDVPTGQINWSAAMYRLHKIDPATPPEALYAAWLERLHPDDRERADQETQRFLRESDLLSIEFREQDPDGTIRWIHGRGRMIRDDQGSPLRMIGVNIDITERKSAEEALRESEQRIRDIAENFPGVIFRRITYPDGRVEYPYFSGFKQNVFHLPREQLAAIRTMEDVARLVHFEDLDGMIADLKNSAASLTPLDIEGRIVSDEGEVRWVRSISSPRPGSDGALIWDGILIDVTDRHHEQGERERAAAMLRLAIEVAGVGTWEFDPCTGTAGGSTFTNELFGITDNNPAPLAHYMDAVHPDDAERVHEDLLEALRRKSDLAQEYRVVAPDGTLRWIGSRMSYVRLADGSERMIGALSDLTERKRREDEREQALLQHQILLKELDHRVKNNLQMVTSMLLLQAARVTDASAREQFDRAVERIRTIADLHAQFSVRDGSSQVDFGAYLAQLCERIRASILVGSSVELRCERASSVLDVDRAVPLGLMINELITNSIKYAFPGGRPGTIEVELLREGNQTLVITVRDDGVGLPGDGDMPSGFGTRIIEGLRQQINATVDVVRDTGSCHIIRLPL